MAGGVAGGEFESHEEEIAGVLNMQIDELGKTRCLSDDGLQLIATPIELGGHTKGDSCVGGLEVHRSCHSLVDECGADSPFDVARYFCPAADGWPEWRFIGRHGDGDSSVAGAGFLVLCAVLGVPSRGLSRHDVA